MGYRLAAPVDIVLAIGSHNFLKYKNSCATFEPSNSFLGHDTEKLFHSASKKGNKLRSTSRSSGEAIDGIEATREAEAEAGAQHEPNSPQLQDRNHFALPNSQKLGEQLGKLREIGGNWGKSREIEGNEGKLGEVKGDVRK